MNDEVEPDERHPVLWGLGALVAVTVVVGGILGGGALAASQFLGLADGDSVTGGATDSATLYLPRPTDLESSTGPLVTLPGAPSTSGSASPTQSPTTEKPESQISLSAGQTSVGQMEPIDLTGTYPEGEGALLQVQRFEDGQWSDFPVTASVSGTTFTTFVQTGRTGPNRFRVVDTESGATSNPVKVRVG